jgi:NADH-quinone oxidoreductase subunit N
MLIFWPFYICALISAYYGAIAPLYDTRVSRLLAFSGINFAGNFMMLLSAANNFSIAMAIYFLGLYMLNIVGILGILSFFYVGLRRVTDFTIFLNSTNGVFSFILTALLLNFAGLPPLVLFFGKLAALGVVFVFTNTFMAFNFLLSNTIVMLVYIRILRFLWFGYSQSVAACFDVLLLPKKQAYFFIVWLLLLFFFNILFIFGFDLIFSVILAAISLL